MPCPRAALLATLLLPPQDGADHGLVAYAQACKEAGTDVLALNVAAHPDDEAGSTMAFLRRHLGYRTTILFITNGEGGQNAIGPQLGGELARLRIAETKAAAAVLGAEPVFISLPEFGYSKTAEETFAIWGKERTTTAITRAVAMARPDLVLTNHGIDRGHGHHQATGIVLGEAVRGFAAKFEWKPKFYRRVAWDKGDLVIDGARLDPVRGTTFAEQARQALMKHASQGPWGAFDSLRDARLGYLAEAPTVPEEAKDITRGLPDLFHAHGERLALAMPGGAAARDALRADLERIARGGPPGEIVPIALRALRTLRALREWFIASWFNARSPNSQNDLLLEAVSGTGLSRALDDLFNAEEGAASPTHDLLLRVRRREDALQRVVFFGAGLSVEVAPRRGPWHAGGKFPVTVVVRNGGAWTVSGVRVEGRDPLRPASRPASTRASRSGSRPASMAASRPAGAASRRTDELPPGTELRTGFEVTLPDTHLTQHAPGLAVRVEMSIDGERFEWSVRHEQPLVDRVELQAMTRSVLVPARSPIPVSRSISFVFRDLAPGSGSIPVSVTAPPGVTARAERPELVLARGQTETRFSVQLEFPAGLGEGLGILTCSAGGAQASVRIRIADVVVPPALRVGVVRGPDSSSVDALRALAIPFRFVEEGELDRGDLSDVTTVLVDLRSLPERPDVAARREKLHAFMERGGRVAALYHKPAEWSSRPGEPGIAPEYILLGDDRVTGEDAEVKVIDPLHPLVTKPNTIRPDDWAGWVQERLLYVPFAHDPGYEHVIATADPGEPPLECGLLFLRVGSGSFVYSSLALHRQLRELHPGALRLFVNLLAP